MNFSVSVSPPLSSGLKYLNIYWMDVVKLGTDIHYHDFCAAKTVPIDPSAGHTFPPILWHISVFTALIGKQALMVLRGSILLTVLIPWHLLLHWHGAHICHFSLIVSTTSGIPLFYQDNPLSINPAVHCDLCSLGNDVHAIVPTLMIPWLFHSIILS